MINPILFLEGLIKRGITFCAGVPDSLLANLCASIDYAGNRIKHVIAANEGNAVGLAIGYHLATGRSGMVYMQNSGLGNATNPLVSLADPEVSKIPMLLVIGWRGEPGVIDEPQHITQGKITIQQLDLIGIPYWIVSSESQIEEVLDAAVNTMLDIGSPVAIVVKKSVFSESESPQDFISESSILREEILREIVELATTRCLIIATTGKTSRELYEIRVQRGEQPKDFLTIGGMGHASSIALGFALAKPNFRTICLDGDGSMLMHMGALPVIAKEGPPNLVHVLLNNSVHESVGGQPTAATHICFRTLSMAIGYKGYYIVRNTSELRTQWEKIQSAVGPVLVEVKIKVGSRGNLGRPTHTAEQNKKIFMELSNG